MFGNGTAEPDGELIRSSRRGGKDNASSNFGWIRPETQRPAGDTLAGGNYGVGGVRDLLPR